MAPSIQSSDASAVVMPDTISDSADKYFGMENFGNTCYCNSVLQCLYYSKPFRERVLAFTAAGKDQKPVPRRLTVPGLSPHPFTVDPSNATLSTSTGTTNTAQNQAQVAVAAAAAMQARINGHEAIAGTNPGQPSKPESKSLGRRMSIFGNKSSSKGNAATATHASQSDQPSLSDANFEEGSSVDGDGQSQPPALAEVMNNLFSNGNTGSFASSKMLHPGLQGLSLGARYPGQNIPVVGFTEDPFATQETRKRSALVKGPIINLDLSYADYYGLSESLFTSLKDVFECMAENKSRIGVVAPIKLIQVLKRENELFRTSMHQDAHEFLNFLLNQVIENIDMAQSSSDTDTKSNGSSAKAMDDIFQGILTSETKCLTCETVSRRDEQFLDLSIDIERNSSVTACLRQFSASEMLCERNKFNCDHCGGLHEAEKRMKVKKLPKILALHLKRFKYTEDLQRNVKLFHRVVYPKHLRLDNTTDDAEDSDKLYELYAVVVHIGGGPYHGHYVSIVKTETAGWLLFDDEMVEAVDPTYVFNFFGDNKGLATAYVLFYQETTQEQYLRENLYTNVAPPGAPSLGVPSATASTSAIPVNPAPGSTPATVAAPAPPIATGMEPTIPEDPQAIFRSPSPDEGSNPFADPVNGAPLTHAQTTSGGSIGLSRFKSSNSGNAPPAAATRRRSVAAGASVNSSSALPQSSPNTSGGGGSGIQFWKKKDASRDSVSHGMNGPASGSDAAAAGPNTTTTTPLVKKRASRHLSFSFKKS